MMSQQQNDLITRIGPAILLASSCACIGSRPRSSTSCRANVR